MVSEASISPLFSRLRPDRPRLDRGRRPGAVSADSLPLWLRRFRVEVLLWAFRERRPVDAAALVAVLGAKHARVDEPFAQWSRHTVRELLWVEVGQWCELHDISAPPSTATTMWTLLDHLDVTDGFGCGSDPLALLREPLLDSGGVNAKGRKPVKRHPSQRSRRGGA